MCMHIHIIYIYTHTHTQHTHGKNYTVENLFMTISGTFKLECFLKDFKIEHFK